MEISKFYKIKKQGLNSYYFVSDSGIKYCFILSKSDVSYDTLCGGTKNILELSLKCGIKNPPKDYKVIRTIIIFMKELVGYYDAIFLQTHNQLENSINFRKTRGKTRVNLWNRICKANFEDHVILTNYELYKKDIPCLIIRKKTIFYKQIVNSFNEYCFSEFDQI